jgi:DNA segregation ATPase FtsK/SpoIIIE, S-DNA-T family
MSTQVARRRRARARSKRSSAANPVVTREITGLCIGAVGVFLASALFLGFGAGPVGGWLESVLRLSIGRLVVVLPLVLVVLAVLLVLDHPLLQARPMRLGLLIGLGTSLIAVGSGALGLGGPERTTWFDNTVMRSRGGYLGEVAAMATTSTIGSIGTALVVIVGAVAATILISGASIGHVVRRSSTSMATASRTVGRGMASATVTAMRGGHSLGLQLRARRSLPFDDPSGVVTPLRGRRPARDRDLVDGADTFPDLFSEPDHLPRSPALGARDEDLDAVDEVPAPSQPPTRPSWRPAAPEPDTGDADPALVPDVTGTAPTSDSPDEPEPLGTRDDGRPAYRTPSSRLLRRTTGPTHQPPALIADISRRLEEALGHFGITASVTDAISGPRVTRYELQLAPGTKVGRITALRDDLAYALAARDELRIIAPIPGKQAVGVEVPNPEATLVTLGDIYREFPADAGPLMTWLGLDISGKPVYVDLSRMPHLLIAGSTGTGKSVCLNVILASLLLRSSPNELKMILIDPKKVELNHYESIPHLLTPVVTNMRDASAVLANIVREMESRYELMGLARARNLRDWNEARLAAGQPAMPTILVLIDELADLMMVSPAEVEDAIIRLAQKSRAVGIHLVLATQRPSADVITGMIKANVPSRVAFAVSSQVDSRVILDAGGAESLLGSGDMLFRPVGTSRLQRLQGAYVSEEEIRTITDHWRGQGRPEMRRELLERPPEVSVAEPDPEADEMLARAIELVIQQGTASVSLLQRRLGVGYARAGRLVDGMELMGVVSGHEGSKPRSVLVGEADLPRLLSRYAPDEVDPVEVEA